MNTPLAIQITNLTVSLGSKKILSDISVELPQGAIGLLGPNGAGKSTLIKTLMGFIKPDSGSAKVLGYDCKTDGAAVRLRSGYMPEDDTYIPGMSAVEFVSYCGRLCGLPPNEAMLRAHQSLHYCGLGEARYRKVDTYSTGMRQRIKLAQALVHDPDLLFLDEPTNGLDPQGRKSMLELIRDVAHNKGISVILSSHLLPDVESVCDHVMVLFQGRLATAGLIQELKRLAQISYELRLKGEPDRFLSELKQQGFDCAPKRDGLLRVRMSESIDTQVIFQAARESGVQIRQLVREEMTLKEVFAAAIRQNGEEKR